MSNEKLARGRAENTARLRRRAESVLAMPAGHHDEDVIAAAEHIMATTTEPTMADVEWDDEKHRSMGATTPAGYEVVMLWVDEHECFDNEVTRLIVTDVGLWDPKSLTPNGKRYELREAGTVKESLIVHPETLTTLEDYEGAPEGTIVASNGKWEVPHMRQNGLWWRSGIACDNEFMARNCHPVLRWGWDA